MSFGNGPRIVTNGLILSLDAADQNSYVSVSGNNFWSGSISVVQAYNRALSAAEIQQNYNAQKSRFGLT